ncbi:MAG: capsular polysaccharide biosynthesis protein [Oscillospiraceae bacterium]|nr:capsular polysaccharide biosynthesis protein [Oscillospiraceae bacterium]
MNVDLHCHILPGIDDGSESSEMSLEMLRRERAQGVGRVVLTPHFYRHREDQRSFLKRRQASYERLLRAMEKDGGAFPELKLGAEVAMTTELRFEDLSPLCIEGTNTLLLELPFTKMGSWYGDVRAIIERNTYRVVLAHVERFRDSLDKKSHEQIMELPCLKQINTSSIIEDGFFRRRQLLKWVADGDVHLLGTDAHNLDKRPVNIRKAIEILSEKGHRAEAKEMIARGLKISGG